MNYFLEAFQKYAVFSGRSRRAEYWYFFLFNFLIGCFLAALGLSLARNSANPSATAEIFVDVYGLIVLLPTIAVSVRRLHDIGMSGWWYLLSFVPFLNLVLLWYYAQDSTPGANQYGPNPKEGVAVTT